MAGGYVAINGHLRSRVTVDDLTLVQRRIRAIDGALSAMPPRKRRLRLFRSVTLSDMPKPLMTSGRGFVDPGFQSTSLDRQHIEERLTGEADTLLSLDVDANVPALFAGAVRWGDGSAVTSEISEREVLLARSLRVVTRSIDDQGPFVQISADVSKS